MTIIAPRIALILSLVALAGCSRGIHESARRGNAADVEANLKKQPELVNARDGDGWTPLHIAADGGRREIVEALLAAHADVNATNPAGYTALHLAVSEKHKKIVAVLLANQADVNAKESSGMTPLYFATMRSEKEIAELLRMHGGTGAFDPLIDQILVAAGRGDIEEAMALIKEHPELVNAASPAGMTSPLHLAAINHRTEMVAFFLTNHADVNARDHSGITPLHFAATTHKPGLVQLLIANNADVNAKAKNGIMPLHRAASGGLKETVILLLDHGADVDAKDSKGKTPVQCARESAAMGSGGRTEIIELLQKRSATARQP